jgi:glyceraldehyde 3-phosphate dehydrogenase
MDSVASVVSFFAHWSKRACSVAEIEVVAINDLVPASNLAYFLKYDTTQGRFKGTVETKGDDALVVNGHEIKTLAVREGPAALPWGEIGC